MAPPALIDPAALDFSTIAVGIDGIRQWNPQRDEMEHLTAILSIDDEAHLIVGYKDVRPDEFWVRGHIPGRPLLPGVIMCEAAAQLASCYFRYYFKPGPDQFVGFGGMEEVRFRSAVAPGDRLVIAAKGEIMNRRRSLFATQGFVGERMVFQAKVIGIIM